MKAIFQTGQFKKDFKRLKKRCKDLDKLKDVVSVIAKDAEQVTCRFWDSRNRGSQRGLSGSGSVITRAREAFSGAAAGFSAGARSMSLRVC